MKTIHMHLREHLLNSLGIVEPTKNIERMPSLEELRKSEWSIEFETLMRNRLIMGAFRYGCFHSQGKPKYDRTESIEKHVRLYREDGNLEHLVDIANIALCEFEESYHPLRHFKGLDDSEHIKKCKEIL